MPPLLDCQLLPVPNWLEIGGNDPHDVCQEEIKTTRQNVRAHHGDSSRKAHKRIMQPNFHPEPS